MTERKHAKDRAEIHFTIRGAVREREAGDVCFNHVIHYCSYMLVSDIYC